jgi:regulator of protease activity HflC (stomatin/prohibitin superfamily)
MMEIFNLNKINLENGNKAEGEKKSKILVSEAIQLEQINQAEGEAQALKRIATAKAESLSIIAKTLNEKVNFIT